MKSRYNFEKLVGLMILFISGIVPAMASEGDMQLISEADSAYARGDYDQTIALYDSVIKSNGATASLLFNLGNAYYKSGNEGEARVALERAKRLDPSNGRINQNIAYLASRVQDANKAEMKGKKGSVAPDAESFFAKVRRKIAIDHSSNSWAEMAATAFVLFILALAVYIFAANVKLKKIGFFSSFVLVALSAIFIIFAEMAASQYERKDECVLTSFKSTLLAEPSEGSKEVGYPLHRGTKLQILDSQMDAEGKIGWYKVKLNSGNIGWLPSDELTII